MALTVTHGTMIHFMIVSLTLWLGYNQLMIKQSVSLLVMLMIITLSGWSWSLLLIDTREMLWIFSICRVVRGWFTVPLTLLVTLNLVMMDVIDIVDEFVGSPLRTIITALSVVCF